MSYRTERVYTRPGDNQRIKKNRVNMHDGVADWCDCCVCEPEAIWEQVAEEMQINLSDHEDDMR